VISVEQEINYKLRRISANYSCPFVPIKLRNFFQLFDKKRTMDRKDRDLEPLLTCKLAVGILHVETEFLVHIPGPLYKYIRVENEGYKLFTFCWISSSQSGYDEEFS
jgi:hypothetical protein